MVAAPRIVIRLKQRIADLFERPRYVEYCAVVTVVTITVMVAGAFAQSCVSSWYSILTVAIDHMGKP